MILPVGTSRTTKNTYRIFFEVTIFQHSPLTRRVFYNNINNNNSRRERASSTSSSGWYIYKSLEAFQHHIVFIFNFQRQQLFDQHQHLLTFRSATYLALWPFDQQHLQYFDLSINNIFSTLTFRSATIYSAFWSATSSALWSFNQQQHLKHFDQQHL